MKDTNQASEDELKVLLESNGWKFYEELNGFRKESKYTIPMFSTDQQTNYDKLSAGNYYELKQAVQSAIRTEKLKLLDEVVHQSTVNLKSAKAVAGWAELRKKQLEAEL